MKTRAYRQAMFALLGLGTADLAALNLWAIPSWLNEEPVTDVRSATDAPRRPSSPPLHGPIAIAPSVPSRAASAHAVSAEPASGRAAPPAVRPSAAVAPGLARVTRPVPAEAASPAAAIAPEPRTVRADERRADILFHRGTWWVGPSGRRTLRRAVERLTAGARIELEGHADESGSTEINRRISERRVAVVARLLVQAGVDPARIDERAFGEERATGTGYDRRVELIIRGGP